MQHLSTSRITTAALQHFLRFQHLSQAELHTLADQLHVETARAGQCLFCAGYNNPRELFLLGGELKLIAADGRSHRILATSDAARQPIATLRPARFTVVAKTAVEYVLIDTRQTQAPALVAHTRHARVAAMDVAEITPEDFERAQADYLQRRWRQA